MPDPIIDDPRKPKPAIVVPDPPIEPTEPVDPPEDDEEPSK